MYQTGTLWPFDNGYGVYARASADIYDFRVKTSYCLKHVNAYHKWQLICRMKPVSYDNIEWEEPLKQAGSEIATACAGGACEIPQRPKK